MKIYTKTGDGGQTGLFGGTRVSKASARVASYGDVDELNSVLGVIAAHESDAAVRAQLERIQGELFTLGAELASTPDKAVSTGVDPLDEADIERFEHEIDALERDLAPLKSFVLPGGHPQAARLHLARTTCRRAERGVVALAAIEPVRAEILRYLNRLSDLLFAMARHANFRAKVDDVPWLGRKQKP
jgi:cob(I)alamin adenosyltransferase